MKVETSSVETEGEKSFVQLADGSLKLSKVTEEDTGNWSVLASNDVGSIARKHISLIVTPGRTTVTVRTFQIP